MWHPHLKRNWIDEHNFEIIDNRKTIYPTSISLLQLRQSDNFLNENEGNPHKMQCGCRFLKQDVLQNSSKSPSLLELQSNVNLKKETQVEGKLQIYIRQTRNA